MTETMIPEYRGPKPDVEEDTNDMEMNPEPNAMLDESQVEALIAAIEASPLNTNGKTSELAVQAALYLTGDDPHQRERDFIDELVKVQDIELLKKELEAFSTIYEDFSKSTIDEEKNMQVYQTKYRLKRIISHIKDTIDINKQQSQLPMLPARKVIKNSNQQIDQQQENVDKKEEKNSIFDSNWFRFAAFAVFAVVILLVIVVFVQWLRVKYEKSNGLEKEKLDTITATAAAAAENQSLI